MVLHGQLCGRVGRCQINIRAHKQGVGYEPFFIVLFFYVGAQHVEPLLRLIYKKQGFNILNPYINYNNNLLTINFFFIRPYNNLISFFQIPSSIVSSIMGISSNLSSFIRNLKISSPRFPLPML